MNLLLLFVGLCATLPTTTTAVPRRHLRDDLQSLGENLPVRSLSASAPLPTSKNYRNLKSKNPKGASTESKSSKSTKSSKSAKSSKSIKSSKSAKSSKSIKASPSPSPAPLPDFPTGNWTVQLDFQIQEQAEAALPIFVDGITRWRQVIIQDLPDVSTEGLLSIADLRFFAEDKEAAADCPPYPDIIDDFYMCVVDAFIDGFGDETGSILGYAINLVLRGPGEGEGLPIVGFAVFETEEIEFLIQAGSFFELVLHEMGHAIGIISNGDENCPADAGNSPNAEREFRELSNCDFAPPTDGNGEEVDGCIQ